MASKEAPAFRHGEGSHYDDDDEEDASDMGPQPPSEGPQPPDNRIAPPEPAAHYHAPALKLDTLRAYG